MARAYPVTIFVESLGVDRVDHSISRFSASAHVNRDTLQAGKVAALRGGSHDGRTVLRLKQL